MTVLGFISRTFGTGDRESTRAPTPRAQHQYDHSRQAPGGSSLTAQAENLETKTHTHPPNRGSLVKVEVDCNAVESSAQNLAVHHEQQINNLREKLQHCETLISNLTAQKEHYKGKYMRRDEQCSKAEKQLEKTAKDLEEANAARGRHYQAGIRIQKANKNLAAHNKAVQTQLVELTKTSNMAILNLQMQAREKENLVKVLQEDVYKVRDGNNYTFVPDSTIAASLDSLERAITEFCREHALKTKGIFTLAQRFQRAADCPSKIMTARAMVALEDDRMDKKAPGLLLAACITHEIYQKIFGNPFFFADRVESGLFVDGAAVIQPGLLRLTEMAQICYGSNHKSINVFRSEFLRLLAAGSDPKAREKSRLHESVLQTISKSKTAECQQLAGTLLDGVQTLVSPVTTDMTRELQAIVLKAVEVSDIVLIQRCSTVIHGLPNLPAKFDSTSKHMQPHKTYEADLEDDDKCLDGKDILLVTNPGIVVMGSSDGSDESVVWVLKKARVWMGKL